jgi:hypothetical protein
MKFIKDYFEFRKRTMPVRDDFNLDISPDLVLGLFFQNRLDELKQYCIQHPQYHIISVLPSAAKANKPLPMARFYLLAEGDPNPELWYVNPITFDQFVKLEILKFDGGK